MKILLTTDPEIPVPPTLYGGIERIADSLAKAYREAGHQVVLLAHPDSTCSGAETIIGWKGLSSLRKGDILKNALQLYQVAKLEKPDIIHSFSRLLYLYPTFLLSDIPMVQSYQREITLRSTMMAARLAGKKLAFTACAAHLFQNHPLREKWTAIYNFTDTDYFIPDPSRSRDYLFFLGRIEPIKGTAEAVKVALATGEKLMIAGNIPAEYQWYFDQEVKPHLSDQIQYVGPVNDEQKRNWFQGAKAFLFPISWEEPFGIVMAESLACGVPVIAFKRGSVPEVVEHGVTGWVCQNLDEMIQATKSLNTLSSQASRIEAEQRFSCNVISGQYLELFQKIRR